MVCAHPGHCSSSFSAAVFSEQCQRCLLNLALPATRPQQQGEQVGAEPSVLFKVMQTGLEMVSPSLFQGYWCTQKLSCPGPVAQSKETILKSAVAQAWC